MPLWLKTTRHYGDGFVCQAMVVDLRGGAMKNIIPLETVAKKILIMRGHKVMLNRDLAGVIYG